jgi:uncharacterized protein
VIVYLDSSALLKRVVAEAESRSLSARIRALADDGAALLTSDLAWVEVSRALRRAPLPSPVDAARLTDLAMSGVATAALDNEVVALARRLGPPALRTLDALHLATAILLDVDILVAYDHRLTSAAQEAGLLVEAPAPVP